MTKREMQVAARIKKAVLSDVDFKVGHYCTLKNGNGFNWLVERFHAPEDETKTTVYRLRVLDEGDPWQADVYSEEMWFVEDGPYALDAQIAALMLDAKSYGLIP